MYEALKTMLMVESETAKSLGFRFSFGQRWSEHTVWRTEHILDKIRDGMPRVRCKQDEGTTEVDTGEVA